VSAKPGPRAPILPILMSPGPTRVPERVLRAGARPMIHHRSPEFSRELAEVLDLIGPLFGTRNPVLPIHSTGRGAMEAAICNVCSAGDEIAVCCNGRFGEMWARIAGAYGMVVHRLSTDWARDIDLEALDALMERRPAIRAVAFTYCDTSTGVRNDVEAACRLARARGVLALVDGVSAIGGMPIEFDEWGADVAIVASQKCLMSSPGLAFAAVSDRAWQARNTSTLPHGYWDFEEIRAFVTKPQPQPPGTPPVHTMLQVAEALRMMHEEGLDRVFQRHEEMAAAVRSGADALGLSLQCPRLGAYAATVTAIALPAGVSPHAVRDRMRSRGIETAEALGPHGDSAFRIGHMGDIRMEDVERTLAALKDVLAEVPRG
jgi:aspartate aminotransferase-like enzyme